MKITQRTNKKLKNSPKKPQGVRKIQKFWKDSRNFQKPQEIFQETQVNFQKNSSKNAQNFYETPVLLSRSFWEFSRRLGKKWRIFEKNSRIFTKKTQGFGQKTQCQRPHFCKLQVHGENENSVLLSETDSVWLHKASFNWAHSFAIPMYDTIRYLVIFDLEEKLELED